MNTIEERATSYASRYDYKGNLLSMDGDIKNAYMQGATDQRKIDIDKACEWLLPALMNKELFTNASFIKQFKKAMED